jgi:D-inositol-3-phosphate glycosyltransferase
MMSPRNTTDQMSEKSQCEERSGKVAVVGPHPPLRGGISHFSERFCTHLEEADVDVLRISFSRLYPSVLFPGRSQYEPVSSGSGAYRKESDPAALVLVDSLNPLSWKRTSRVILSEGCPVVVFMYWMPFFAIPYARIARRLRKSGVRIVGVVHNVLPHERHVGDAFLSKLFLTHCDEIVTLSREVGDSVGMLLPESEPVELDHPVYDQFGGRVERSQARESLGLDENDLVILFFGIVRAYKGLNVLLEAMPEIIRHHDMVKLIVAGEFYEDRSRYEKQIRRLGLEDRIVMRDEYVPGSDVATYFSAADVLVQPYTSATQSGVVQIAVQFSTPTIVTDAGGLGVQIGPGLSERVVPAGDAGALSRAVVRFFTDLEKSGSYQEKTSVDEVPGEPEESGWEAYVSFIRSQLDQVT